MPELADVEGFRRYFAAHALDHTVRRVEVPDPDVVRNTTPQGLGRTLDGRRFGAADRWGKWLLARIDGANVVLHFGMTGSLSFAPADAEAPRHAHDRVVLVLDHGELRYRTQRKLGGLWIARGPDELHGIVGDLGPDALAVDEETFLERLAGHRGGLKSALMNQSILAGIGNELSDEILWRARLHPGTDLEALDLSARRHLYAVLHDTLEETARHGRIPQTGEWLDSQRGADEPVCPHCHHRLEVATVAGRTSYWCPHEQRR